ncbi:hypothetical protein Tco_0316810 [Tanacetum coccineum]
MFYIDSKIFKLTRRTEELGIEHKFINKDSCKKKHEEHMSITEPDYKNLNKNDIEDMYLLIMNGKVPDYTETDATLNRVLKGLKSYNNDVKYGYIQRDLTEDEVEYLKLFEEIEVRLKYRNQMRRWDDVYEWKTTCTTRKARIIAPWGRLIGTIK